MCGRRRGSLSTSTEPLGLGSVTRATSPRSSPRWKAGDFWSARSFSFHAGERSPSRRRLWFSVPLTKMISTKFPASAVLMELSADMKRMGFRTVKAWSPRSGNQEPMLSPTACATRLPSETHHQNRSPHSGGIICCRYCTWESRLRRTA